MIIRLIQFSSYIYFNAEQLTQDSARYSLNCMFGQRSEICKAEMLKMVVPKEKTLRWTFTVFEKLIQRSQNLSTFPNKSNGKIKLLQITLKDLGVKNRIRWIYLDCSIDDLKHIVFRFSLWWASVWLKLVKFRVRYLTFTKEAWVRFRVSDPIL